MIETSTLVQTSSNETLFIFNEVSDIGMKLWWFCVPGIVDDASYLSSKLNFVVCVSIETLSTEMNDIPLMC